MYKYLEHQGKKFPIRISNTVLGEWQAATGKTDMKNLNFRDIRILITESLKAGYRFAERDWVMKEIQIEKMVDDQKTIENFLLLISEFYPSEEKIEGDVSEGNSKAQPKNKQI